ncbi:putative two-component system response regulator [Azospirillum brasilense]|uniref:Putative two-component system response regulator n=1 Tax=Azospirillum brasilense TaxID=192 RepID=A0A560BJY1_AZOBR|nr:HD domain-containing phosphohydrolase [Azospirillum brasilense]TWA72896.1 putative two-component system response regulator [Azospirillum brasilense]
MQVVIVDDDPSTLFITSAVIRRIDDAEPIGMGSPLDALDWLAVNTPDLILIDHVMPDLDGLVVLERIRAQRHLVDVPVVMITADTSVKLRVAALESGCTDFLTKPIVVPELLARAQNLLRLRLGQRMMRDQAAVLRSRVEEATAQLRQQAQELVARLARAAEYRDPETGLHIERMASYSRVIAESLGMDPDDCARLAEAAPMHDIGKIGIPDAILLKPGRLTDSEMRVMREHPAIGHAVLQGSEHPLICEAAEIALGHHEKYDGTGYPKGLVGEEIPLACRIVAIADVFDALTTARPYKKPWPLDTAKAYIVEHSGTHFDPVCVDAFLRAWTSILAIHDAHPDPDFTGTDGAAFR